MPFRFFRFSNAALQSQNLMTRARRPHRAMAAVPGGFAMGNGETRAGAISYGVQMYALKGEDKFVAVPDVYGEAGNLPPSASRAKAERGARAAGAAGAAFEEDEGDFDAARSGDFL